MTIAELKMILWKLDYTFKEAKTMPNIPHSYSLKTKWNNEELFKAVVNSIRQKGVEEYFYQKKYTYFYANGYKYWTMNEPINQTVLINRAKI